MRYAGSESAARALPAVRGWQPLRLYIGPELGTSVGCLVYQFIRDGG